MHRARTVTSSRLLVFGTLLTTSGCFGGFSRHTARETLEASSQFRDVRVLTLTTPAEALAGGKREGLWRIVEDGFVQRVELTVSGQKHFSALQKQMLGGVVVEAAAPVRRKVHEVTGIRDSNETTKEVEFVWTFEGLDPVVARYTGIRENTLWSGGVARFTKYDDGWRLVDVETPMKTGTTADGRMVHGLMPFERDEAAEAAAARAVLEQVVPQLVAGSSQWTGGLKSPMAALRSGFFGGGLPEVMIWFKDDGPNPEATVTYVKCAAATLATFDGIEADTIFFQQTVQRQPFDCGPVRVNLKDRLAVRLDGENLLVRWLSKGVVGQWNDTASATMTRRPWSD